MVRSGNAHLSYTMLPVSTTPGARSPVVHLTAGTVVALLFTDSTGAPWPVTSETTGNARWFSVKQPKGVSAGNMLVVSPLVRVGITNVIVTLKGRNSPVSIVLRSRSNATAVLPSVLDVRVPGRGPQAIPPVLATSGPQTISAHQIRFLDGVPPSGAKPLTTAPGLTVEAWLYHHRIYVRTRGSLVFPAWEAVVRGSHHLRVYTIAPTPQILVDRHGREIHITLSGVDTHG